MKYIITESQYNFLLNEQEEQENPLKNKLRSMGLEKFSKLVGGINNVIDKIYDGDIIKFSEETTTPIAYMSTDGMNLYLHEALVKQLGIQDTTHPNDQYYLGKFTFGSKNGTDYSIHTRLEPHRIHNQLYYKVLGSSGDYGFGHGFISKRNTLGKRYRQQIYKQIIDKYDLKPYMKIKTFY